MSGEPVTDEPDKGTDTPAGKAGLVERLGLLRSLVIYYGQPWRRRALKQFYAGLVEPGALVFDVGAHVGSRTCTLLSLGASCVAIEPQPVFAAWLARLFCTDARVTLVWSAVGEASGTAQLQVSSRHPTVSTLSRQWIGQVQAAEGFTQVRWDRTVSVPVTTLDALIAEHGLPQFCKIDVEGMEAAILTGLSQPIDLVAVEYIPAALDVARDCVNRLERLGRYEYKLSSGESHRFDTALWLDAAAVRVALDQAAGTGRSGDLYARLRRDSGPDQ